MNIQFSPHYLSNYPVVEDWLVGYCKRNKIEIKEVDLQRAGEIESKYEIVFKSQNQFDCFLRNGSKNFPYFEFL